MKKLILFAVLAVALSAATYGFAGDHIKFQSRPLCYLVGNSGQALVSFVRLDEGVGDPSTRPHEERIVLTDPRVKGSPVHLLADFHGVLAVYALRGTVKDTGAVIYLVLVTRANHTVDRFQYFPSSNTIGAYLGQGGN